MTFRHEVCTLPKRLLLWIREKVLPSRFLRNVSVMTVAKVVGTLLNLVQGVIVARLLGPSLYGVVGLVLSYPGMVYRFLDARSADASIKYLGEFSALGEKDRVLGVAKLGYVVDGAVAIFTFALVLGTAGWAAETIVKNAGTAPLIIVQAAALMPGSFSGTSRSILQTLERFPTLARLDILTAMIRVGLIVVLLTLGFGVPGVVWGNALGMAIQGVLLGVIAYRWFVRTWGEGWLSGSISKLRGRRREILSFLVYNDLNALLGMVVKQLDMPLLGYFRGPLEVGYYRLACSIASLVGNVVGPLQAVAYPRLSKLYGLGNDKDMYRVVRDYAFKVGAPLAGLVVIAIPLLPFAITLIYGEDYLPSSLSAQLLLLGGACWMAFFWLKPFFYSRGQIKYWMGISIITVIVSIIGFVILIPKWGFLGISALMMVTQLISHTMGLGLYIREKKEFSESNG